MKEIKTGWNAAKTHDHFKPKIITVALKMTEIFNLKNLEKKEKKNLSLAKALICGGCVNSGEINFEFRIIFSNWWRKFTLYFDLRFNRVFFNFDALSFKC